MYLRETPYIKINKNGQIDYTAARITGANDDSSQAAAWSYNTIIGLYTRDSTGNKIYLETSGVYSQTTATKHKPRAAAIAAYNNYIILKDINPQVLHDLYFIPYNNHAIDNIINESKERKQILNELQENQEGPITRHYKHIGKCKSWKDPQVTNYKNGNKLRKYYYQITFDNLYNIYYEVNQKTITTTIKRGNSKPGKAKTGSKYNKIINTIVNIKS